MKKLILSATTILSLTTLFGQTPYWQQQVNYQINVSLNDTAHALDGFEKIEYINHSPDTLKFIWFHLWPNAYKNDQTAFSDQLLTNGNTKFYFSGKEDKGYINRLDFRVDNLTAHTEDHPQHIDIVKLVLPSPLPPGGKILITTPFHVRLPRNFSRGGHEGQSYQVTQWYPKPAVYDKNGWHPMPYLDQGEFYSEFGNFEVNITVPENYVVAATGELQDNQKEQDWMLSRTSANNGGSLKEKEFPPTSATIKILKFKQNNIHDFAWFADKRFIVNHDTLKLSTGRTIDAYAYYLPADTKTWQSAVHSAKNAIQHYSKMVGEYPFNVVSVVEGPESFGGGMEYPTITVISPTTNAKGLDNTIVHEVGHNWFYGILASNERDHPWMDEGVNSYYEEKYMISKYGDYAKAERIGFETKAVTKTDQAADLASEKYTEFNYGASVYYKTAEWLRYLETQIGTEVFNRAMQAYFNDWKFKHPQPSDFQQEFEKIAGRNLDPEFAWLHKTGLLPNQHRNGSTKAFILDMKKMGSYVKKPTKDLIVFGPAIGVNSYDKLMVGGFLTNIKLPPSAFQFLVAPLYATGPGKLAGIGFASYSFYPTKMFQSVDIGMNASLFTMRKFTDDSGVNNYLRFSKLVPGIKFLFKQKDPLSHIKKFIEFRSYYISEQALRFYRDTLIQGIDTTITDKYAITREGRSLLQTRFVVENNRALYPYRGELKAETGKYFLKLGFTGNYFFNYVKEGGLNVRVFAGKFFYTGSKTFVKQFATDRYHLNLSGPDGYEDYTYNDYFVGRNYFEGWQSQQGMLRDGAFKVRTDLLAQKVGKTDDWLVAANFTSTIPTNINPFLLLPVKIPVKLFADLGSYAEAWQQNAQTDRFLFDAGLNLPFFKETINIYIPLFSSGVYSDYYKSTITDKKRFWKKISFTIDISNFNFRKFERNLDF